MTVLVVLRVAIATVLLALGMNVRQGDLGYLWRRPGLLVRSLLAMYVFVPLVAILMVRTLEVPRGTEIALLVLAICAGAPLLPRKAIKLGGDPDYVFSLVVTTSLLAVVSVPVSVRLMTRLLPFEPVAEPSAIAGVILKTFLVPLTLGMMFRWVAPTLTDRIEDRLLKVGSLAMLLASLAVIAMSYPLLLALGWRSFVAFAVFSVAALAIGHLFGGPEPQGRTSLAVSCATRHVGLALLVATGAQSNKALPLVAGYVLASALASLPYFIWRRRVHGPVDDATAPRHAA